MADALQPELADNLIARMEESVFVEDEGEPEIRRPEIPVVEGFGWSGGGASSAAATAVVDRPVRLQPVSDLIRQRTVIITDVKGHRIITAIEVLSHTKKSMGRGLDEYLEKRNNYVNSDTNLVEIDLLRTGNWTHMLGRVHIPPEVRTPYRITVDQPSKPGPDHYAISLRSRLPGFEVPLRPRETPAVLNLQQLMEKVYEMGRYDGIDYSEPCTPPLDGPDAEWAKGLIAAARPR